MGDSLIPARFRLVTFNAFPLLHLFCFGSAFNCSTSLILFRSHVRSKPRRRQISPVSGPRKTSDITKALLLPIGFPPVSENEKLNRLRRPPICIRVLESWFCDIFGDFVFFLELPWSKSVVKPFSNFSIQTQALASLPAELSCTLFLNPSALPALAPVDLATGSSSTVPVATCVSALFALLMPPSFLETTGLL